MFSTPSIRINQENTEIRVPRKPAMLASLSVRKPFKDRSVNSTTPDMKQSMKPKSAVHVQSADKTKELEIEDYNFDEYSFKDVNYKVEEQELNSFLSNDQIKNILRNYTGRNIRTPPPSDFEENPFELQQIEMDIPAFNLNDTLERSFELDDSMSEPTVNFDFGDLDESV